MNKKLISSAHIEKPTIDLQYYLVEDGGRFGVLIAKSDGENAMRLLTEKEDTVRDFILTLAENTVTPTSLNEVADDFQYELSLN